MKEFVNSIFCYCGSQLDNSFLWRKRTKKKKDEDTVPYPSTILCLRLGGIFPNGKQIGLLHRWINLT
jgi:hypothetical protein